MLGSLLLVAAILTMPVAPRVLALNTLARPRKTPQATSTPEPTPTTPPSTPTPTSTTTPLMITTTSLPNGNVCASYTAFITANKGGGLSLDVWTIVSGTLPAGLTMATSYGIESTVISGTPTTVQTTTFTVQVQDSAGETATQPLSITIDPPLPLTITNQGSTLASGTVGTTYSASLFTNGGCLPLVWSITAGQLPPGLALTQNSRGQDNNIISGTPTTAGKFDFTATVTSHDGQTAFMRFSITIN
jgi:Putative Ig domain